jgi:arsenate reductase (thioredoxin)
LLLKRYNASVSEPSMTYNTLFLCTGNSARSVLAEGTLRDLGAGRFRAFSAGSKPGGIVNPFALELLRQRGHPADGMRSKSWDEFAGADAPKMDFIITVCDNAAGETCPHWPGHPASAHWGVEDPAAVEGSDDAKRAAFATAYAILRRRIELLLALPLDKLDALARTAQLKEIGKAL